MDIPTLLHSCRLNLETLALNMQDPAALKEAIDVALRRQDYVRLSEYYYMLAESILWETEHNAKWFATLDTLIERVAQS